jgi:hypothetical protein
MVKETQAGKLIYARDLVNGRVRDGKWEARPGVEKVAITSLSCLWRSNRLQDTLAIRGTDLVKVNDDWSVTVLLPEVGTEAVFAELNNIVVVATPSGLLEWDGEILQPLTLSDPPSPFALAISDGGMAKGTYSVAISFRRKHKESSVSEATFVSVEEGGGVLVTLPDTSLLEPSATHITVYSSRQNGGDLYEVQTVPAGTLQIQISAGMSFGKIAAHRFLSAMPSGRSVRFWNGRLVTCSGNALRFSEAMNYHLHDPRHGFVQTQTRVTFIEPVESGIWVGQTDGVIFLAGKDLAGMSIHHKTAKTPVPWTSVLLPSEDSGDMQEAVAWLSSNGYVLGGGDGSLREVSSGVLNGVSGVRGQTVTHDSFLLTIIS